MKISYSRQQYLDEIAKTKRARKPKQPSKWGRLIAAGSEDEQQALFFEWIDRYKEAHPVLNLVFAVPNGSNKSGAQRAVMQLTGLRPGVPDVCVPVCTRMSFHGEIVKAGLWIEFKRPGGGKVSPEQMAWHQTLTEYGHDVHVCRSWTDAANILIDYLRLPIERLT